MYQQLFERNYGVFSAEEQEKIRAGRIALIGAGGTGGIVALSLARSGAENFILYDDDIYTISNMNRQIGCFNDTLGQKKVDVIAENILRINPNCSIEKNARAFRLDEMEDLAKRSDIIMPCADDWPLSMTALAKCKDLGVPTVMSYPVGAFCRVSAFLPDGPYAQDCMIIPRKLPYDELEKFMSAPDNRKIMQYYITKGGWTQEWFDRWCAGELPHAQLSFVANISASIASLEIIKILTGKWEVIAAPRYWEISPSGAKIGKFSSSRRVMSEYIQKPGGEKIIAWLAARPKLVRLFTKMISR